MHSVFHVTAGDKASEHARDVMLGSATVVHALLEQGPEQYHQTMRELLCPRITEEALLGHPFYIPLLEAKSLRNVSDTVLGSWMGSAKVYIRESVEDSGVLMITAYPNEIEKLISSYAR
jgi:hypothetical protein